VKFVDAIPDMAKKVLIVEDYADVRAMMKFLVRRYGYEVFEAADGYEAVTQARQCQPDLILMDLAMPMLDGLTATAIIKTFEELEHVPIIALSAYGDSNYKRALDAGCEEVINKPLDFSTLEPFLKKYLDH
jgi:CheY-like chemotaxis protein